MEMQIDEADADNAENVLMAPIETPVREKDLNPIQQNTTVLFEKLRSEPDDSCIIALIEAGCDVAARGGYFCKSETLLHVAVRRPSITVAYELIKKGADVNAQMVSHQTPLHYAITYCRLETVCMLLYFGADVYLSDVFYGMPLKLSQSNRDSEVELILSRFYAEYDAVLSLISIGEAKVAETRELVLDLVRKGANVGCLHNSLQFSLYYPDAYLFKLVWSRIDWRVLEYSCELFVSRYLRFCKFSSVGWLECLDLLMESPAAPQLLDHLKKDSKCGASFDCVLLELLESCARNNIARGPKAELISAFLSLNDNGSLHIESVEAVYRRFGFDEVLETVLYCASYCSNYYCYTFEEDFNYLLPHFICGLGEDPKLGYVFEFFKRAIDNQTDVLNWTSWKYLKTTDYIVHLLGFFSLPRRMKDQLLCANDYSPGKLSDRLEDLPEFPSLVELSRGSARTFIKQRFNVQKPYQFYDGLKILRLPKNVADIISFKQGLH